jgi:hypothetical protein
MTKGFLPLRGLRIFAFCNSSSTIEWGAVNELFKGHDKNKKLDL